MEAEKVITQVGGMIAVCGSTLREKADILTRLILRHGLPFVRSLARMFARLLKQWHHSATSRIRGMASSQYVACTIRSMEATVRKVLASVIICLNSNALKIAATQLISVSISQEPGSTGVQKLNGPKGSTVTCNLRLLGGLLWWDTRAKASVVTFASFRFLITHGEFFWCYLLTLSLLTGFKSVSRNLN